LPLVALIAVSVLFAIAMFRRRKQVQSSGVPAKVAAAITEISANLSEANTQAKVEIAAARTSDKAVKEEIKAVLANNDKAARRRQLIALHERLERAENP
jgi:hypothetical protein